MPIMDFECEHCGLAFDKLVEPDVQIATCPECEGNSYKVFPKKAPSINLKYNPQTDMVTGMVIEVSIGISIRKIEKMERT